jgi:hypothetical protein
MEHMSSFNLNRLCDDETFNLLNGLARTRRMKRDVNILRQFTETSDLGIEGEFYYNPLDFENDGQTVDASIIDYNTPPSCQPTLWLRWLPSEDHNSIIWGGQHFIEGAAEWIAYLIAKIFRPRGYILNGQVKLSNSLNLEIVENQLYKNNQLLNIEEMLLNITFSNMRSNSLPEIANYRILRMEIAPDCKRAIEIEDTDSAIVIVLSNVEHGFSLESISREVLLHYSAPLRVDVNQLQIKWSDDSLRAAVHVHDKIVAVYDFKTNRFLKSCFQGDEVQSISWSYFNFGIDEYTGKPISIFRRTPVD